MFGYYPYDYVDEHFIGKEVVAKNFYSKKEVESLLKKLMEYSVDWTVNCLNGKDDRDMDDILKDFKEENLK